ncbi:unnamed protein product, partial [Ascophyllum nodosum]
GKCKFGASCTFSHEPQGRIPVCPFFQQGAAAATEIAANFSTTSQRQAWRSQGPENRKNLSENYDRGVLAGRSQGVASSAPNQTSASSSDSGECCGICLENIPASGKRFGLLNCDHAYCLECLRTWRKSEGPQKDI